MNTPLEACYARSLPLLLEVVRRFRRRYGGDRDELLSLANWLWLEAFRSWQPGRSPLAKRLGNQIWLGLLARKRQEAEREQLLLRETIDPDRIAIPQRMRLGERLAELSTEAQQLARLVLETDRMRQNCRNRPLADRLTDWLLELGWTGKEIIKAFSEIQEALS